MKPHPAAIPSEPPTAATIVGLLDRHRLTQTEFASIAGVDVRTVRKWLAHPQSGSYRPAPRMLWHAMRSIETASASGGAIGRE